MSAAQAVLAQGRGELGSAFRAVALFVWSRHRPLILTLAMVYLALLFASGIMWTDGGRWLLQPALTFLRAAPFFVPLVLFISAASVFSLDVTRRESAFPRYLFTLPVRSRDLALPFITYAALTAALLWLIAIALTEGRVLLAGPLEPPAEALQRRTWTPFLWLNLVFWAQAVIWTPFRHGWLRVVALVALLVAHTAADMLAIHGAVSGSALIALCLLQLPLTCSVAVRAVERARRGEGAVTADRRAPAGVASAWRQGVASTLRDGLGTSAPPVQRPYRSPLIALIHHDVRLRTRAANTIVVALLCASMLILALVPESRGSGTALLAKLVFIGATMLALASLGPLYGNFAANKWQAFPMPAFFAALPVSTGDIAWAKVVTCGLHIGAIIILQLLLAGAVVLAAGADPTWQLLIAPVADRHGSAIAVLIVALSVCWLAALTCAMAMNGVWVGLSAGKSAWHALNVLIIAFAFGTVVAAHWLQARPAFAHRLVEAVPALLMAGAAIKLVLLAVLAQRAGARRLYPWPRLGWICAAWAAAAAGGAILALQYAPGAVSTTTVAAILILVTPVLGIVGAPLALACNRTR